MYELIIRRKRGRNIDTMKILWKKLKKKKEYEMIIDTLRETIRKIEVAEKSKA